MRYIENNEGMGGGRISLLNRAEMYGANGLMGRRSYGRYIALRLSRDEGVHY